MTYIKSKLIPSESIVSRFIGKDHPRNDLSLLNDKDPVIWMEQVHHNKIVAIDTITHQTVLETDGVITTQKNLNLVIKSADCLPVLAYHPSGVIAALHAGRKGTEAGILAKLLKTLKNKYQLNSELTLWFGPAICFECYQIDRETDLHYSLIDENKNQLRAFFSDQEANLLIDPDCTVCHNQKHYSYRQGDLPHLNHTLIKLV